MESQPFVNSHGGPKSIRFSHSQDISPTLEATTPPSGSNNGVSKTTQVGSSLYKDAIDALQVGIARNTTDHIESLTKEISTDAGRKSEVSHKRLTAQALREFDLYPVSYFGSSGSMQDFHLGYHINQKGAILQLRGCQAYPNDTTYFNDPLSSLMNENQAKYQKENTIYICSDADVGSHNYQATELWSRTSDQEPMIDMPEPEYDTTDTNLASDLAAKANDFAGIGGRFEGGTCEGYASADDFIVEGDFIDKAE